MRVPSLHVFVFIQKTSCDLFLLFFCFCLLMVRMGEERWEVGLRGRCMVCNGIKV